MNGMSTQEATALLEFFQCLEATDFSWQAICQRMTIKEATINRPSFIKTKKLQPSNQLTYQLFAVLGNLLETFAFSAAVISDQSL